MGQRTSAHTFTHTVQSERLSEPHETTSDQKRTKERTAVEQSFNTQIQLFKTGFSIENQD